MQRKALRSTHFYTILIKVLLLQNISNNEEGAACDALA